MTRDMPFNSFLFPLFFVGFFTAYFALPRSLRRYWLLAASCGFYMAAVPRYLLVLLALILADFALGQAIDRREGRARKTMLALSVASNLGALFVFKYFDFFSHEASAFLRLFGLEIPEARLSLVLPVGLSFHTFQSLSYVFEVYYRRQKPERNLITYALYVLFWPQLVAGPIERPQTLLPQLATSRPFSPENFTAGARLMLMGFVKKTVIADRLGLYVDSVFASPQAYSGLPLWLATYFFAFQIYCDFSGYTDIARGAARMMGVDLMRNFDSPYLATSIQDFWRRWHISLSTWFRDYVYLPLGGNRLGAIRTHANLLLVFLASGLWHGANWTFVAWGALHGIYLIAFKLTETLRRGWPPVANAVLTFHLVAFAWIFFRATSMSDALAVISGLFSPTSFPAGAENVLGATRIGTRLALVFALLAVEYVSRNGAAEIWLRQRSLVTRWAVYYAGLALVLAAGVLGETRFIYFQF